MLATTLMMQDVIGVHAAEHSPLSFPLGALPWCSCVPVQHAVELVYALLCEVAQ